MKKCSGIGIFMPRLLCCLVAELMFHATAAIAAEIPGGMPFPVQAAIVQENGEPVVGAALCAFNSDCRILTKDDQGFELEIRVPYGRHCFMKRLSLDCASGDCSFSNGRSSVGIWSDKRDFPFFEGSFGQELVYRQQIKLGSVLLILPDFIATCRMP